MGIESLPAATPDLAARYDVVGTALVAKDTRLAQVEIGDTKQAEFFPQVKFLKFGNQANTSFRFVTDEPATLTYEKDVVVYTTASVTLRLYLTDDLETNDGHELEAWFAAPPRSNVLTFTIQDKGVTWWQQPFYPNGPDDDGYLWEPNGRGGRRQHLPHIEGSYVGDTEFSGDYTALGGPNYRSGKAIHVYRPWAADAKGTRVWCDLLIDAGLMTITVPQDFLDAAIYPVLVDPTFGYSGTAASDDNLANAHILCKAVTNPTAGDLTSITIKGRNKAGTTAEHDPALFSDLAAVPLNKLASVESGGSLYGASDAEVTTNISLVGISATQYWLGSRSETGNGSSVDNWFKFDASGGTGNMYFITALSGADWEATAAGYTAADNEKVYIFGTFTASGGGAAPLLPPTIMLVGVQ